MPRVDDLDWVRAVLETDREWAAYALGDLDPRRSHHCDWRKPHGATEALALVYRGFAVPVLFTLGHPVDLESILDELRGEPALSLSVRPAALPLIQARWRVRNAALMERMVLDPAALPPRQPAQAVRLGPEQLPALTALYADGHATGEQPDFFHPAMPAEGVFYGVWEAGELAAAAGTHLVSRSEQVAAIGNVYTRRGQRGRGLARQVTQAVARELLELGIRTVVLNVNQQNAPARRVYESLGFRSHGPFYEGTAEAEFAR